MSTQRYPAVRRAAVAGRFYPGDALELRATVERLLAGAPIADGPSPKAIIAPHAGYLYSGPIAASAYARFMPDRRLIRRIVLLGPSHFLGFEGLALSSAQAFETPLGLVSVDTQGVRDLMSVPGVAILDQAHEMEHSLEVQLPYLQVILERFELVPLVAGDAPPAMIARVLEAVWGSSETRFVVSSDLSHYLDSERARVLDHATARAIESLHPADIGENQACGRVPIRGLLHLASARGLRARAVDLRNSGDTAGSRDRVVGYGAFVFESV
jgi:MEMO1 family protein